MNEEEEFFGWLDGELDSEAATRVAARVAASPELSERAKQHRKLTAGLRGAFEPVMREGIGAPSFQESRIVDFGKSAPKQRSWFAVPQWAAMAATLVVGVVAGAMVGGRNQINTPVAVEQGQLVAAADLERELNTRLASAPQAAGVRIGLTFQSSLGQICRSFSEAAASGLACRDGEHWRIHGLFQGPEGQAGNYRMAASEDPRLAALIDETIMGEPFGAGQEKAARDRNWQN